MNAEMNAEVNAEMNDEMTKGRRCKGGADFMLGGLAGMGGSPLDLLTSSTTGAMRMRGKRTHPT